MRMTASRPAYMCMKVQPAMEDIEDEKTGARTLMAMMALASPIIRSYIHTHVFIWTYIHVHTRMPTVYKHTAMHLQELKIPANEHIQDLLQVACNFV
jgi:hypothetical protein